MGTFLGGKFKGFSNIYLGGKEASGVTGDSGVVRTSVADYGETSTSAVSSSKLTTTVEDEAP